MLSAKRSKLRPPVSAAYALTIKAPNRLISPCVIVDNNAHIQMNQTVSNEMLSRIALLVCVGHIPLQILMCNISGSLLMQFLNSVDDLITLITKAEIPFNIFLSFDDQIQKQLLKYSDSVFILIKERGLTIDQLVEQPNEKLNVLLSHPNSLEATLIIQDLITSKNFHS
jgi:hypothetical protein